MTSQDKHLPNNHSTWFQRVFVDLAHQMQWSFLPPLMVYFAAGVSGLTSVVGAFRGAAKELPPNALPMA